MEINLYSSNGTTLTLDDVVTSVQSISFSRKRSGVGTFTIKMDARAPKAESFAVGKFVWIGPVKSRIGRITAILKSREGNKESLTIKGTEAKGLTNNRAIWYTGLSYYTVTGSAENVIKTAIGRFFGSTEANRNVPLINVGSLGGAGSSYLLSERFTNLQTAIESCSQSTGVWWRFEINTTTGKLDVVVTAPTDRTSGQTVNPPAPFSDQFKTIGDTDYTEDTSDYRNVAIVAGQGELSARTVRVVGTATGLDRVEDFFDARDLSTTGDLDTRGANKLAEVADTIGIDVTAMDKSQLVADEDYFLGDLVTVSAFGVSVTSAVTDITENWDSSGYSIDLTFGKAVPEPQKQYDDLSNRTKNAISV